MGECGKMYLCSYWEWDRFGCSLAGDLFPRVISQAAVFMQIFVECDKGYIFAACGER